MTIADLQSVVSFQGWSLAPHGGPRAPLTPRERQIVDSVLDGRTTKEIAFDLGVSDATVRVLYSRAMKKLGRSKKRRKSKTKTNRRTSRA
ncbi:MAG TPA: helix-turn-helix transcriptional regulator [Polyangia bacterium]|nr:helix-turn-helix transcriptional regulator [Polyangia bacterium]